ncbi:MAG: hypothetical protein ACLFPJ_04890 [Candidatus Woesearchaeota archaeon]
MPKIDEEGATGEFDNKGAMFLQGGFIYEDSDKNPIEKETYKELNTKEFRKIIKKSMNHDNATLLYPDGFAYGINLDNGFFSEIAGNVIGLKQAAHKRSPILRKEPPKKINSNDITKSYSPTYIKPPYGSRTKLSSCVATCMTEPRMYYMLSRSMLGLRGDYQEELWKDIKSAQKPMKYNGGPTLTPPYLVVCHNTRYKKEIMTGITRILGYGKFGEFSNITLEELTRDLINDLSEKPKENHIIAKYDNKNYVALLREYSKTTPGKRRQKTNNYLLYPKKDFNLNINEIEKKAKERYKIL